MYSLVIAEDEKMMRESLVKLVDWASLGFTMEAAFSNGAQLIDYLRMHIPDVVLTDIQMIRVDGQQQRIQRGIKSGKPHLDPRVIPQAGRQRGDQPRRVCAVLQDAVGLGQIADQIVLVGRDQTGEEHQFFPAFPIAWKISTIRRLAASTVALPPLPRWA